MNYGVVYVVQILQSRLIRHTSSTSQRKVLLLAYYRSGSTLTGQMVNYNPSALYWFEPLAAVSRQLGLIGGITTHRNWYHFDNGTEKYVCFVMSLIILIAICVHAIGLNHIM